MAEKRGAKKGVAKSTDHVLAIKAARLAQEAAKDPAVRAEQNRKIGEGVRRAKAAKKDGKKT